MPRLELTDDSSNPRHLVGDSLAPPSRTESMEESASSAAVKGPGAMAIGQEPAGKRRRREDIRWWSFYLD